MSMKTWTEEGYGYPLYNGENTKNIIRFLIDNKAVDSEKLEKLENLMKEDLPNITESDIEECINDFPAYAVGSIICKKEGLSNLMGYIACSDTDIDSHLGFFKTYPWDNMTERSRKLTQKDADKILEKYAKVLGIEEKPDYFELEYYG